MEVQAQLKEIIGFPYYIIDVRSGKVYSRFDGLRELKGRTTEGGLKKFVLRRNGTYFNISHNRLWYAAYKNIPVERIPTDIVILRTDNGDFQVTERHKMAERMNSKREMVLRNGRMAILNRRCRELGILMRCFETGDKKEAYEYLVTIKESCIARFRRSYGGRIGIHEGLWEVAVDVIMNRLSSPSCRMSDLTNNVIQEMKKEKIKSEKRIHAVAEFAYQNARRNTQKRRKQ